MRATTVLSACVAVALLACTSEDGPTQPEAGGNPAPAALSLPAASNTWTPRAPTLFPEDDFGEEVFGFALGTAPNSTGESIVYAFGGALPERGGAGTHVIAYNVATDTWTAGRNSEVGVFYSNGVGKIGGLLYFSGGYNEPTPSERPFSYSNKLWAYDYSRDRLIPKADVPILSAEGVTGIIGGKLYVLPGMCQSIPFPANPATCAEEPNRRLYRYDPATNTWVTRRQAPHFHRQGAAAVIDGKFYVAGGQGVTDLDVYDPATNTWRTLAPIPTGGLAVGAALQGQFYVVVQNFNGGSPDHRAYAYNRVTNKWKARAAPDFFGPVTRVALDGSSRLFIAGGDHSALYTP